jgi:hypothetical protein
MSDLALVAAICMALYLLWKRLFPTSVSIVLLVSYFGLLFWGSWTDLRYEMQIYLALVCCSSLLWVLYMRPESEGRDEVVPNS